MSHVREMTVIMPALNEEKNILLSIKNVLSSYDESGIRGELLVINDGSTDRTETLVREAMLSDPRIRLLTHSKPQGIGASFWDGVDHAAGDSVVLLPGDNENDPREIFRYWKLLEHVDMVIPFVFNKEVRSLFRNGLSYVYRFIINSTFIVHFNYTNGTVLYRKSILKELGFRSTGFFFQTDILVRIAKRGYLFAEVPYRLNVRKGGVSKATTFPSFVSVVHGYFRLIRDFYFEKGINPSRTFSTDSSTGKRKQSIGL